MRKLGECDDAVSPIIGVILLLGLTVIMVSIIATSVLAFKLPESAPHAKILVVEAKGDVDTLYKNNIVLRHKGGDSLFENNTRVIIRGKGYAYTGTMPSGPAVDILVTYKDLSGNNYGGSDGNKLGEIVEGSTSDAGDTILLYGSDGKNIGSGITEHQGNTVDYKWTLKAGTTVLVTIIDTTANEVIAVSHATVKEA